jgi:threonine/homoserine/homoserine lactone efflux protein
MDTSFLAFLGIAIFVIVTPGPDTAVATRNIFLGGFRAGVATAMGISLGLSVWALAAAAGVTALLVASETLFLALKIAGGAYLVFLGLMSIRAALKAAPKPDAAADSAGAAGMAGDGAPSRPRRRMRDIVAFRQGLISNLSNPKIAVFFSSLLPQFVPASGGAFLHFVALGLSFMAIGFAWLCLYSWLVAKAGSAVMRPGLRRALEAATGTILIGLGLRLATDGR